MGDGDDITPRMALAETQHRVRDPRHDGGEALTTRRNIMRRRDPEGMPLAGAVRRDISLDADRFLAGNTARP